MTIRPESTEAIKNLIALKWVAGGVSDVLKQASDALEAYAADNTNLTHIRLCAALLHQTRNILHMVELRAGTQLAEEMEKLVQALIDKSAPSNEDSYGLLMSAMLQLPVYLGQVQATRRDDFSSLAHTLNALRAQRGELPRTENSPFNPDLLPAHTLQGKRLPLDETAFKTTLKKLRHLYGQAMVGLLRDHDVDENLRAFKKIFEHFNKFCSGTARAPLWDICLAMIEGMANKSIPLDAATDLLRQVDKEIRSIDQAGLISLDSFTSDTLLTSLLHCIVRNQQRLKSPIPTNDAPLTAAIYKRYRLDGAQPDNRAEKNERPLVVMGSFVPEATLCVMVALADEFGKVKDLFDGYSSGTQSDNASLQTVVTVFRHASNTLRMLGLRDLHEQVGRMAEDTLALAYEHGDTPVTQSALADIARHLLDVEAAFSTYCRALSGNSHDNADAQNQNAYNSVLRECRNDLEQAKESLIERAHSQDGSHLTRLLGLLFAVRGALYVIAQYRAAQVLEACIRALSAQLDAQSLPNTSSVEAMAYVIGSVEYYLECLDESVEEEQSKTLQLAEDSLGALGYAVTGRQAMLVSLSSVHGQSEAVLLTPNSSLPPDIAMQAVKPEVPEVPKSIGGFRAVAAVAVAPSALPMAKTAIDLPEYCDEALPSQDIDDEIADIFLEEAKEVLDNLQHFYPIWRESFADKQALTECRRGFHTLKGSGRMVQATQIAELAWAVEQLLNSLLEGVLQPNDDVCTVVEQVLKKLPSMMDAFSRRRMDTQPALSQRLRDAAAVVALNGVLPSLEAASIEAVEAVEAVKSITFVPVVPLSEEEPLKERAEEPDYELWEIFATEADTHLHVVEAWLSHAHAAAPLLVETTDALQRALHTLKGSAYMAQAAPIAELVAPFEKLVKDLRAYQIKIGEDFTRLMEAMATEIRHGLAQIEQRQPLFLPHSASLLANIGALHGALISGSGGGEKSAEPVPIQATVDPARLNRFIAEDIDTLMDVVPCLDTWQETGDGTGFARIELELAELADSAELAGLPAISTLARAIAPCYRHAQQTPALFTLWRPLAEGAHTVLIDFMDKMAASEDLHRNTEIEQQLNDFLHTTGAEENRLAADETAHSTASLAASAASDETPTEIVDDEFSASLSQPIHAEIPALAPDLIEPEEGISITVLPVFNAVPEQVLAYSQDIDSDLLGIFLEEADELLEELERLIAAWQASPTDSHFADALRRNLHTLKGGARMAGLSGLGSLAHDLETQLEQFSGSADEALFTQLLDYQDRILAGIVQGHALASGQLVQAPVQTEQAPPQATIAHEAAEESATKEEDSAHKVSAVPGGATIIPFRSSALPTGLAQAMSEQSSKPEAADAKAAPEMVKVSADLLESLVNLAGETSINRARVEQQLNDMEFIAEEMGTILIRAQDLLRRLAGETDMQIQSRISVLQERHDGFDPLEMDRYSTLQQLTRSLSESASDLLDIRSTLAHKLRDTETLLVQQTRINTALQEGLMRSRMVPFSRIEPRLRRIVRQMASELGKEVSFDTENVEGTLDRNILERMLAPLEHMLRNAVDHGIEMPDKRRASGKSPAGRIVLSLGREGGDVLVSLRDDGGGINIDAVRHKAIERGLLKAEASISDTDALQFILHAGFSTAERVTQISGRGVGMDVVSSEIKQLGGSMSIHSAPGQGTEFVVRLPFTVSVNRALMVRIGDGLYAVPLNAIEGVVRISPEELDKLYKDPNESFNYAGRAYHLLYLGALLRTKPVANMEKKTRPEPVILLRDTEHSIALHVDQLAGSREIVVKSLGTQFAAMSGLSGATLLGDGSVVLILDLPAMVRTSMAQGVAATEKAPIKSTADAKAETMIVMVCDDSVTVRKVTSRLLEREGFDVMLAQDGVDALLQMQDRLPDLLLLDIEMPRMDGFEVASTMKNSSLLKDIPIIMITSRTGDKHRERATDMGVDRYMGKPFAEDELLVTINNLIGKHVALRAARAEVQ